MQTINGIQLPFFCGTDPDFLTLCTTARDVVEAVLDDSNLQLIEREDKNGDTWIYLSGDVRGRYATPYLKGHDSEESIWAAEADSIFRGDRAIVWSADSLRESIAEAEQDGENADDLRAMLAQLEALP